jgi:hypothetical protein
MTDVDRLCVTIIRTRGRSLETSPKATDLWVSGFKFALGRNIKGKVFGICSHLKKLSKYNDVHAQKSVLSRK